jgi:hypothetical protein
VNSTSTGGLVNTCAGSPPVEVEFTGVGEQLCPVVAARAAAEQRQRARFGARRAQRVEAVGEREGDAFEHGIAEQRAIGCMVHAEKHALRIRVVVRRAFAGQIRQEERRTRQRVGR